MLECVLATGFPADRADHPVNNLEYFNDVVLGCRSMRRLGAASYDLAMVALGVFDAYWELNLSPWDIAAGQLIVTEAGGKVISLREDRKKSILSGSEPVVNLLSERFQRFHSEKS